MESLHHELPLLMETPWVKDIGIPVGRDHFVAAALVIKEARDRVIHHHRLALAQIIVEHQAGLVISKDRLTRFNLLPRKTESRLHVRAALVFLRSVRLAVGRKQVTEQCNKNGGNYSERNPVLQKIGERHADTGNREWKQERRMPGSSVRVDSNQ